MNQNIYKYENFGIACGVVKAINEHEAAIKVRDYYRLADCDPIIIEEIADCTDVVEICA